MSDHPRVLIVDHVAPRRSELAMQLKAQSFDVTLAGSATTALAMLGGSPFAGIIVESDLPRHNGLWVLDRIREAGYSSTRILLTGETPDAAHTRYHHALVKPVSVEEIVELLRREVWVRAATIPEDEGVAPIFGEPD